MWLCFVVISKTLHFCVFNYDFLFSNDKIAVDCQWGEWKLGECSATCGNGTRTNTRTKLTEEQNGGTCSGSTNETETCNVQNCPG